MRVLVTGASGYLGRAVVAALQDKGHEALAYVRSGSVEGVENIRGDLLDSALEGAMNGVEAVIHTAASMAGDEAQMMRDTVAGTQALMAAVQAQPTPPRVVITSSMSVYGADCPPESLISEDSPRETRPELRDGYTRTKIAQEDVVLAASEGLQVWMLRIGAVFGPGRLWNGHIGVAKGPVVLRLGSGGEIPLSFVDHAAGALVAAAETPAVGVEVVNVVDEDRPDRMRYLSALKAGGWPRVVIPASWRVFAAMGRLMGGSSRLPGLLRGPVLRARMMPLRYSNDRLKERLLAPPRVLADTLVARSLAKEDK